MQAPPGKRFVPGRGGGIPADKDGVALAEATFDDEAKDEPSRSCDD